MRKKERESAEAFFRRNEFARFHCGAIYQDGDERFEGEVFFGNFTKEEFKKIPLDTKRLAGPARSYRGEVHEPNQQICFQLWSGADSFGVYVQTSELKKRRIAYRYPYPE